MQQQPPYWLTQIHARLDALEKFKIQAESLLGLGKIVTKWGVPAMVFLFLIVGHEEKAKILVEMVK